MLTALFSIFEVTGMFMSAVMIKYISIPKAMIFSVVAMFFLNLVLKFVDMDQTT